jgi:hypothetical protein
MGRWYLGGWTGDLSPAVVIGTRQEAMSERAYSCVNRLDFLPESFVSGGFGLRKLWFSYGCVLHWVLWENKLLMMMLI